MIHLTSPGSARTGILLGILALVPFSLILPYPAQGQRPRPIGREAAMVLEFGNLEFDAPEAEKHTLRSGVTVFFLRDRSLPLVSIYARFRGGYSLLPRDLYAASTALPGLLRSGGTSSLPPDSADFLLDFYALQVEFMVNLYQY